MPQKPKLEMIEGAAMRALGRFNEACLVRRQALVAWGETKSQRPSVALAHWAEYRSADREVARFNRALGKLDQLLTEASQ